MALGSFLAYVGKETTYITNLFRRTGLKIVFRIKNAIGNLLSHRNPTPDKLSLSGVYKLTCPDCNKAYVGQTGRLRHAVQGARESIQKN